MTGNTATGNGDRGIWVGVGSTVTRNTTRGNGAQGILVFCPSAVIGNTATGNADASQIFLSGAGRVNANNAEGP